MAGPSTPVTSREHTGDLGIDRIQKRVDDLARMLKLCPFVVGRLISVELAAATDFTITHRLGTPAACFVVRGNYDETGVAAAIGESTSQAGLDVNNQLRIVASAACAVDLWFYPRASKIVGTSGQSP